MSLVIGVPVKAFGIAKQRLSPVLDAEERSRLGMSIAARTVSLASQHATTVVLTGDSQVVLWAARLGFGSVPEGEPSLDSAAQSLVAYAAGRPWMTLHADLPKLTDEDLRVAVGLIDPDTTLIAPSWDGGTSMLASTGEFPFSYGTGSFHRHLAERPWANVITRPGLSMDLDTPADLETLQSLDV